MSSTTNLDVLKINYLSQSLYDQAVIDGDINENEIYMTPTVDCIVDQSLNTGTDVWSWRKWESGLAECWGSFAQSSAINNSLADTYTSTDFTTSFPSGLFTGDAPQVNCNISFGTVMCWAVCTSSPTTTSIGKWRACRISANTNTGNKYYNFKVSGRWK